MGLGDRPLRQNQRPSVLSLSLCAVLAICNVEPRAHNNKLLVATQQSDTGQSRFISFAEASDVIHVFSADLPEELVQIVAASDSAGWDRYVQTRDAQTRDRLHDGDLDTLANLLLFGTSYTRAAPLTPELLTKINASSAQNPAGNAGSESLLRRIEELALALTHPAGNERLEYFRQLLEKQHYRFETSEDIFKVKQFLGANLVRMLHEDISYARALEEAQHLQENGLGKRSRVFAQRGISLDTSLFPSYAIEDALRQAHRKGLLRKGIGRVAVIGPGLDVINKDQGCDFYPEQTTQPFLILDSLARLGLADLRGVELVTFDISEQVNQHISSARARAQRGGGYTIQLPLRSDISWNPGTVAYWKRAGTAIGRVTTPIIPGKGTDSGILKYKAIVLPAAQILRAHPVNLDVIYQRQVIPNAGKFDLILATNVFVYYDTFEQALAMANLSSMLREDGMLLTNDALPELDSHLHNVGFSETEYSPRPHDGDRITFYRQTPPQP